VLVTPLKKCGANQIQRPRKNVIYVTKTLKIPGFLRLDSGLLYKIISGHSTAKEKKMHNLETAADGRVAFATLREPAWHQLGTVFEEEVSTGEMLDLAHLSKWNVQLEDMPVPVRVCYTYEKSKDFFLVVRDNPFEENQRDILGVVGNRYRVMQNESLFEFADNLLDGGGRWETAGSIKGGRVVFGSLSLQREIVLDPEGASDQINTYLLVHTSHDGSVSVQASVTPVRVVCQNTLNMALRGVIQSFKIRHTQSLDGKVEEARRALDLSFTYMDKFEEEAKALFETEITVDKFAAIINTLYPMPEIGSSKATITKWENKVKQIDEIYNSSTVDNIRGTAWGAFNTLTERLDWYRTPRKGSGESVAAAASGFDPMTNAEKNRILSVVKELTTV